MNIQKKQVGMHLHAAMSLNGSLCTVTIPHGSAAHVCAAKPGLCWFQFDSALELNWSCPETASFLSIIHGSQPLLSKGAGRVLWERYCREQLNPATNWVKLNIKHLCVMYKCTAWLSGNITNPLLARQTKLPSKSLHFFRPHRGWRAALTVALHPGAGLLCAWQSNR